MRRANAAAANKVVIRVRMKRAGMRWRADNVNPMAAMRNLVCNQRWESDWPLITIARVSMRARSHRSDDVAIAKPSLLTVGFKLRSHTP